MRKSACIILVVFASFLLWRFVRPMNIFVVHEKFSRPMRVEVPEGLESLGAAECGGCHEAIRRPPSTLEVTVRYHLLDEKRRKRIGYENSEPIAYPVYQESTALASSMEESQPVKGEKNDAAG